MPIVNTALTLPLTLTLISLLHFKCYTLEVKICKIKRRIDSLLWLPRQVCLKLLLSVKLFFLLHQLSLVLALNMCECCHVCPLDTFFSVTRRSRSDESH